MTDQNKNQAQKAQPSDLISSMKNKNDLKEADKVKFDSHAEQC